MNKKRYIAFFLTIVLVLSSVSFGSTSAFGETLQNLNAPEANTTIVEESTSEHETTEEELIIEEEATSEEKATSQEEATSQEKETTQTEVATEESATTEDSKNKKPQKINSPVTFANGNGWTVNQTNTQVNNSNNEKVFSTLIQFTQNNTGGDLFKTFKFSIRKDFFQSPSDVKIKSPTVTVPGHANPVDIILFTYVGDETGADGNSYAVFEAVYNSIVEDDFIGSVANATVELSIKIETSITDEDLTEKVVIIESDNVVLEITGPPVNPQREFLIEKRIDTIYQKQSDGTYSEYVVNPNNFPRPYSVKKDDIIYYSITVRNLTGTDITGLVLYENLGPALSLLGNSFTVPPNTINPSATNSKWQPTSVVGKTHEYQNALTIPSTGSKSVTVNLYAIVNKDNADQTELNNIASALTESGGSYNDITGKVFYEAKLITGFTKKNNSVPRGLVAGVPENNPYQVIDGDELTLRVRLYNTSSEKITDTKVSLYVPSFFEFADPLIEATNNGPVSMASAPANVRWKGLTEYVLDSSIWSQLGGINQNADISFDLIVKVKNLQNYTDPCDLYIGAEVSYFASADGTKNTGATNPNDRIEDRKSYTDNDPYNDLIKPNGTYTEIDTHYQYMMGKTTVLPKEYDNTWSQNAKLNSSTSQDEADFDYAFVIKNKDDNGDVEAEVVKQRGNASDTLTFANQLNTIVQSPLAGQNVVAGMDPLPNNGIPMLNPASTYYMKYTVTVNKESLSANITGDITIEDKLPDHFKLISATVGGVKQYAMRFTRTGNSAGSAFSDIMDIQFPANDENHFKVIVPHTGLNPKYEHKSTELKLEFLVKVDLSDITPGTSYKNTATVSYDQKKTHASEKESITYGTANGKGYFNKYVFDPSIGPAGEYVGGGSLITLPGDTNEISYRIRYITSVPLAPGFVIKDNLENAANIQSIDVTITGYNSAGFGANDEPINPQKIPNTDNAFTYTIEAGNKSISFKNDKSVGAFQHYDLDYTIKYNPLDHGKLITNTVGADTVKALKPLKIKINKTDNKNVALAGTEFKAYYANPNGTANISDPVKNTANTDVVIYPETANNTVYFVPKGYVDSGVVQTWNIVLRETNAPSGYTGNIGKEYRIVVTKNIDGDLSYDLVANQTDITINPGDSSVTVVNKPGGGGGGGGGTNPPSPPTVDPGKPVPPVDPENPTPPETTDRLRERGFGVNVSGKEREKVAFLKVSQTPNDDTNQETDKKGPGKGIKPSRGVKGNPNTGDSFHYYIIGVAVVSFLSLIVISIKKKQESN